MTTQRNRTSGGRPERKGAEEARSQLPALIAAASAGHSTIITRHGRPVAAVVPADRVSGDRGQISPLALAGSGHGLWGRSGGLTVKRLRDEWSR